MKTLNMLRALAMGMALVQASLISYAQTSYEYVSPGQLAVQHLVQPGAVVSNVSFFGDSLQFAYLSGLENVGLGFGLSSAACLSNSFAPAVLDGADYPPFLPNISAYTLPWFSGPSYAQDDPVFADLLAVSQETMDILGYDYVESILYDAAWIEFDVMATSDSLTFSYIVCGNEFSRSVFCQPGDGSWSYAGDCYFHDVFSIFVSGPDITGPFHSPPQFNGSVNVAYVPGSDPLIPVHTKSLNDTINGDLWIDYLDLYYEENGCDFDNPCEVQAPLNVSGFSQLLTNSIDVTCGQIYHVKIAMADGFDHIYESFWMLAPIGGTANGAQNPEVNISFEPGGEMTDQVFEDCNPAWLNITRSTLVPLNEPDTVFLFTSGIATSGVDYTLLPQYVIIPAGEQTLSIPLVIVDDGVEEEDEMLSVAVLEAHNQIQDCAISAYVQINDGPDALVVTAGEVPLCSPDNTLLEPLVQGGYGQYTYQWFNGSTEPAVELNSPDPDMSYYVIVGDTCGTEPDTAWFELNELELLQLEFSQDTIDYSCYTSMQVSAEVTGGYGEILYSWTPFNSFSDEPVYYFNSAQGPQTIYLQVTDDCNQVLTDSVFMYSPFESPFAYTGDATVYAGCEDVYEFVPELSGGIEPYFVYFISGMDIQVGTSADYVVTETTLVTILASDACGQNVFATVSIMPFTPSPLEYELPEWLPVTCSGETEVEILIDGGFGEITYAWTNAQGEVLAETEGWEYSGSDGLMVYVTAQDECGQSMQDSLLLTEVSVPLEIGVPDTLAVPCAGSVSIAVDIISGIGPYTVNWFHEGEWIGSGTTLDNLVFLESAALEVVVEDACGEIVADEIWVVSEVVPMIIEPIADIELDCGDILEVAVEVQQSNGQYSTEWWLDGQLMSQTDELILQGIAGPVDLVVFVVDECSQEWEQAVIVEYNSGEISLELPDVLQLDCSEDASLVPVINADHEVNVPEWYVNGTFSGAGDSLVVEGPGNVWIVCEIMDLCGNTASDSVWVEFSASELSVSIADSTVCAGSMIELAANIEGGNGDVAYLWNGEEGGSVQEFWVNEDMDVVVTAVDECGVTASDEASLLAVELEPAVITEQTGGGYFLFVQDTCESCLYLWTLPDGTTATSSSLQYFPESGPFNQISLLVTNGLCEWSGLWSFDAEPLLYVPNAFTPDADGVNDVFQVYTSGYEKVEMWIANRWGEVVFHADDPARVWTGNADEGGYFVPDGVYTWMVHATVSSGDVRVFSGSVVLIR